jgi:hypothetical protein
MNKTIRNILISLGILVVVITTGILVYAYKERQLVKETTMRIIAENKIKQLATIHIINKKTIDSMMVDRASLVAIIDYQKNNPQIIIEKYETVHHNIDLLSRNDNYRLFTGNIAKYNSNRKRYSLQRFKR